MTYSSSEILIRIRTRHRKQSTSTRNLRHTRVLVEYVLHSPRTETHTRFCGHRFHHLQWQIACVQLSGSAWITSCTAAPSFFYPFSSNPSLSNCVRVLFNIGCFNFFSHQVFASLTASDISMQLWRTSVQHPWPKTCSNDDWVVSRAASYAL